MKLGVTLQGEHAARSSNFYWLPRELDTKLLSSEDGDEEVLPVPWDENFVNLLPGESLTLGARAAFEERERGRLFLEVSGRNSPLGTGAM